MTTSWHCRDKILFLKIMLKMSDQALHPTMISIKHKQSMISNTTVSIPLYFYAVYTNLCIPELPGETFGINLVKISSWTAEKCFHFW